MVDRLIFSLLLGVVLLCGCPRGEQAKPPATEGTPRESVALRVLVVNEPGVAEAVNRLRGEWAERSGGDLSAISAKWDDVAATKNIDADVVIFPSRYLGELGTRDWLQPVRSSVLEGNAFDGKKVYPIIRRELMRWGDDVMALPLGVELVMPEKQSKLHPGLNVLAIAAPRAVADGREGVLFDPQTMKPRITDAPFVEALWQLAKAGPEENKSPENSDVHVVPVLGFSDRLIGVTSSSRNGASAFRLVAWLASAETSAQLDSAGERMLSVRRSHEVTQSSGEPAESAKSLERAMNADRCLLVPRIPGIDQYVAALDDAARTPPADKAAAAAALQKVAERWEKITDSHRREAQRRAFLKHLQISE